jgi:tetratricopeptide (TPR) repeat protein
LTEAIRLDPTNATMVSDRGLIHVKRGEYDQGITDYDLALRINPRLTSVHERRGDAFGLKANWDKAIADYEEALRLNPKSSSVLHHRAKIHDKLRAFGKASDDYREALRLDPRNVQLLNDLAWLQATCPDEKIRNGPQAVGHAAVACTKTSSADAGLLVTLAAAHAECGDYEEAVRLTRKALDLAPKAQQGKMSGYLELFKDHKPIRNE